MFKIEIIFKLLGKSIKFPATSFSFDYKVLTIKNGREARMSYTIEDLHSLKITSIKSNNSYTININS